MHVRVFGSMEFAGKVKENSMLTNQTIRFEMHAAAPVTPWSTVGMPGVSSFVYCLGSIPAIISIGGVLEQGRLNSLEAKFDNRQLQM